MRSSFPTHQPAQTLKQAWKLELQNGTTNLNGEEFCFILMNQSNGPYFDSECPHKIMYIRWWWMKASNHPMKFNHLKVSAKPRQHYAHVCHQLLHTFCNSVSFCTHSVFYRIISSRGGYMQKMSFSSITPRPWTFLVAKVKVCWLLPHDAEQQHAGWQSGISNDEEKKKNQSSAYLS